MGPASQLALLASAFSCAAARFPALVRPTEPFVVDAERNADGDGGSCDERRLVVGLESGCSSDESFHFQASVNSPRKNAVMTKERMQAGLINSVC